MVHPKNNWLLPVHLYISRLFAFFFNSEVGVKLKAQNMSANQQNAIVL